MKRNVGLWIAAAAGVAAAVVFACDTQTDVVEVDQGVKAQDAAIGSTCTTNYLLDDAAVNHESEVIINKSAAKYFKKGQMCHLLIPAGGDTRNRPGKPWFKVSQSSNISTDYEKKVSLIKGVWFNKVCLGSVVETIVANTGSPSGASNAVAENDEQPANAGNWQ